MADKPPPSKKKKSSSQPTTRPGFRGFVHVNEAVASKAAPYKFPRELLKVYVEQLSLDSRQKEAIDAIYREEKAVVYKFNVDNEEDQLTASSILAANLLDVDALEALQNKWCCRWSKADGEGHKETQRVLYQCYDHIERGSNKRKNPFDSTGCLAHCEILYQTRTNRIMLIRGHLTHNEECLTSPISRSPVWPVHPSVYKDALHRLKSGIPLQDVKDANRELFASFGYKDMPQDLSKSRYRWLLNKHDHRSLYRQFYQLQGIKVAQKDHINLHEWLDPDSPQFNKTLFDAIFHYSPRTEEAGRLEVCIATPEMKEAAWKYAHQSQIIVDGTFGISSKKVLLFIVMGVDETNRGVPLAFLLFSVPSTNWKTAAGYDTAVLLRLLDAWKNAMGMRNGESFDVWVVITDTDLTERAALLGSWSRAGRLQAASRLKRAVNEILPTTNHLEAFNGVLKRKHLHRYQNGGRRLRVDILVHVLILHALPSIFQQRMVEDLEIRRQETLLKTLPGGEAIVDGRKRISDAPISLPPIAYWDEDDLRDHAAAELVTNNQISTPVASDSSDMFTFTCYSSLTTVQDQNPTLYTIAIGKETTTCSCPDFRRRGGACKHIRAAIVRAEILRCSNSSLAKMPNLRLWLPNSAEEAYRIQRERHTGHVPEASPSSTTSSAKCNPITRAALTINDIIHEGAELTPVSRTLAVPVGTQDDCDDVATPVDGTCSSETEFNDTTDADSIDGVDDGADGPDNFAELERTNQQALNEQTIAHALHDLDIASPKLAWLGEWLRDAHLDKATDLDIQRAYDARATLKTVVKELDRMLTEVEDEANPFISPSTRCAYAATPSHPTPSYRSTQRLAANILAPPVENRAQKRKNSYNVH
ncbi:hypothetical protein BDY19DRAFT_1035947 [Irpex rosettiformis]|uniref:Uncharacterized protein n=1 Tax=Irpex rosettiformis TaxID=378272 RepID=A0ACB8U707_9APHY|nr:hypothetical protein BDY19DRAFT_1035947 [Irpex rosettiformis]